MYFINQILIFSQISLNTIVLYLSDNKQNDEFLKFFFERLLRFLL